MWPASDTWATNKDKVKLTGDPVRAEELGFIYGKGSPLTPAINAALVEMQTGRHD